MNVRNVILQAYREERNKPFKWGEADCVQWCGLVALRLTGVDPTVAMRERYDSEITAKREMIKDGFADMGDVAASLLPEIPVSQARAGDWVQCIDDGGRDGLGIVTGAMVAVRSESGLGLLPIANAKRAFRVGGGTRVPSVEGAPQAEGDRGAECGNCAAYDETDGCCCRE